MRTASGIWLPEVKVKCEFELDLKPDVWTLKLSSDYYKMCLVLVSLGQLAF